MTPLLEHQAPKNNQSRRVLNAAAGVAAIVALAFGPRLLAGPAFVDQISIANRSEYDIHVEVTGADRDGWMSVRTARRRSTSTADDVIDQGAIWIFRFRAQGREGGELQKTRAELQASGWSIDVPDTVVVHLRQLGAPPTP